MNDGFTRLKTHLDTNERMSEKSILASSVACRRTGSKMGAMPWICISFSTLDICLALISCSRSRSRSRRPSSCRSGDTNTSGPENLEEDATEADADADAEVDAEAEADEALPREAVGEEKVKTLAAMPDATGVAAAADGCREPNESMSAPSSFCTTTVDGSLWNGSAKSWVNTSEHGKRQRVDV